MTCKPPIDPAHASRLGQRVTWVGALANLLLIVAKFVAGLLGRSQAMIADAVHSVSDFFTDAVVIVGLRLGRKAPDADHHFGHARLETLASAVVGISLLGVGLWIGYSAARDIYQRNISDPNWIALVGAGFSIAVKELLYHYTVRTARHIQSQVMLANAWHHRSDALSSVAVLVGVGAAQLRPSWHILDAYAAILVSLFIAKIGLEVLWGALREMADAAPSETTVAAIHKCVEDVPGVLGIHDLKVRTGGGFYYIQVHIEVAKNLTVGEGHAIARSAKRALYDCIERVKDVIVHVDPVHSTSKRPANALPSGNPERD